MASTVSFYVFIPVAAGVAGVGAGVSAAGLAGAD